MTPITIVPSLSRAASAALLVALLLTAPQPASGAPGFLCSGGSNSGLECNFDTDCPSGACLAAQFVCDGGSRDADFCDCPGALCVSGTCNGGILQGSSCSTENNCSGGSCRQTAQVCSAGDIKGFACVNNAQCPGGQLRGQRSALLGRRVLQVRLRRQR